MDAIIDEITPSAIAEHLYTVGLPNLDLIIRTSGEIRLSGFLLWQSVHSELYFSDVDWPEFRRVRFSSRCAIVSAAVATLWAMKPSDAVQANQFLSKESCGRIGEVRLGSHQRTRSFLGTVAPGRNQRLQPKSAFDASRSFTEPILKGSEGSI